MQINPSRSLIPSLVLITVGLFGCAGTPLVGTWTTLDTSNPAVQVVTRLHLRADGQAEATASPGTVTDPRITCSGTLTMSNLNWSSTASTLSIGGTGTCSGSVVCMGGGASATIDCASMPFGRIQGTDNYTLSSDGNTLMVGGLTYTRN